MPGKKVFFPLLLSLLAALVVCTDTPKREFRVYRLIDNLAFENVLLSPLISLLEGSESRGADFPQTSFPMQELGIEGNPYGIKRKLKIEGAEINTLFAPPESQFRYELRIPKSCYLDFGIGIISDENARKSLLSDEGENDGVMFFIFLELEGKRKMIFQEYCSPPEGKQKFTFSFRRIDLPAYERNVFLTLETRGDRRRFSYWFNPVVYNRSQDPPCVILISVDTLRADHLGCYGYTRNTSPNIDALAQDGALFLNTYASSPWTLPSHISLLTSLHGVHHQVYQDDEKMDPSILTLADILRKNRFCCSAFTGGGFVSAAYGFSKGFDFYRDGVGGVFHPPKAAEILESAVSDWLDQNQGKSFFLFLHTYQPHNPYSCPSPYNTMFLHEEAKWKDIDLVQYLGGRSGIFKDLSEEEQRNAIDLYDAEIRYTDEKFIGPLMDKLKELGIYDETMIVFTSDHGEEFYEHGGWGHGHSLYDESLKVPLIVKFPGSRFKGEKIDYIVSLVDIMPTILEALEIDFAGLTLDGESLFPVINGEDENDREFLADIGDNILNSRIPQKTAMNKGREKLILNKEFKEKDLDFFLSPPPPHHPIELYDLKQDPQEKMNIAHERASFVSMMIREIKKFYTQAKKREQSHPKVDEKLREQLKALGYIQ
jgi:arylsulfatase A-like enzyme